MKCGSVPRPGVPYEATPGCALAICTMSPIFVALLAGPATTPNWKLAISETGVKSFTAS